jgi:CRISPR-associated endonuclease/helicase Cas3
MSVHFPAGRPALSEQALSIWAKSVYQDRSFSDDRYLQLWQHMEDTDEISLHVWDEFVPDSVKMLIAEDVGDVETAKELYRFVAAVHDVGKASPAFEVQSKQFAVRVRESHLRINPSIDGDQYRSQYRHELVGYAAMQEWLESQGLRSGAGTLAHGIASMVAGHHGTSLTDEKYELLEKYCAPQYVGDQSWSTVRDELLNWAADVTCFRKTLRSMKDRPLRRRTQILLTSMVIIADWIASDTRLLPLNASESDEICFNSERRAAVAWRMLRLPKPWRPVEGSQSPDEIFAARFNLPGARLRPVQREAARLARTMDQPGLMIIEANMGEGKTEAALIVAETLAARFHCGGIYYALPSQATVNAMFTRVLDWIGRLPAESRGTVGSLFLAHGKNELNDEYEALRERWFDDGRQLDEDFVGQQLVGFFDGDRQNDETIAQDQDGMQAVINTWLTGRKRGNLSDFVVGTIDQVLMAGLKSKHVVLRHLALAGKVVILDEIHSNTAYMNVYMETVLSWLGAYGVPVIMLSATLPQERRQAFLKAYQVGANAAQTVESAQVQSRSPNGGIRKPPPRRQWGSAATVQAETVSDNRDDTLTMSDGLDLRYPLISLATANKVYEPLSPEPSGRFTDIHVQLLDDDDVSLIELLRDRLKEGGCAVVIRDTVTRAQQTYDMLHGAMGSDMDVTLAHSRFLAFDRARIDRDLIRQYGKHGDPLHRTGVVIATQVVEQSLDVDFDLMITDIAPIDLVLQRAGRLHRHHRGNDECERPRLLREAQLVITGVTDWQTQAAPEFAKGLERVYPRYLLMRSLASLGIEPGKASVMNTPKDIPRLVQTVYGEGCICPKAWREGEQGEKAAETRLEDTRASSERDAGNYRIFNPQNASYPFTLDNWLRNNVADPDTPGKAKERSARTGVRESEDSFEVIVLQRHEDGALCLPTWGDFDKATPLPIGNGVPSRQQVRDILSCTISLSLSSLAYQDLDAVIAALECDASAQWWTYTQQDRSLRGQLLVTLDKGGNAELPITIQRKDGAIMKTLKLHYSMVKGWQANVEG